MDDKRFDSLTRMFGRGASRRSILKGLLGLGGAAVTGAVVDEAAEARTISITRIPTPPPPTCGSGLQLCGGTTKDFCCPYGRCFDGLCCPDTSTSRCGSICCATGDCTANGTCCTDSDETPCGKICCPTGTCTRDGITDICCPPTEEYPDRAPCGLDCCDYPLQCCDGECCPEDTVCLVRVFGAESVFIEEEVCCPIEQTCDGRCCSGTCFYPPLAVGSADDDEEPYIGLFERECCPAEEGFTFCPGTGPFAIAGLCCSGDTPNCCHNSLGLPVCISADVCCTNADCVAAGFDADCITCNVDTNACEPVNAGISCNGSECGFCTDGHCAPDDTACTGDCEVCQTDLTCGSTCSANETCCGGHCYAGAGLTCCTTGEECIALNGCNGCSTAGGATQGVCVERCNWDDRVCCEDGTDPASWFCYEEGVSCCPACATSEKCCFGQCTTSTERCCETDADCDYLDESSDCEVGVCENNVCVQRDAPDETPCFDAEEGVCCGGLCLEGESTCTCAAFGEACAGTPDCCDGLHCSDSSPTVCVECEIDGECPGQQCCSGTCADCCTDDDCRVPGPFSNAVCSSGQCQCTPSTQEEVCDPATFEPCGPWTDGCGGTVECGECTQFPNSGCSDSTNGICTCFPSCLDTGGSLKVCGAPDGCVGTCSDCRIACACPAATSCNTNTGGCE